VPLGKEPMLGGRNTGSILRRWFSNAVSGQLRRVCRRRTARLRVEELEPRDLLSSLVMPLGASITAGYPSNQGGYRAPLLSQLSNAGISITYVGSQTTYNPSTQPNLKHEGHIGYFLADIDGLVRNGLITQYNPDIILLYAGTNNLLTDQNAAWVKTDYAPLLDDIFAAKPSVRVIVAPLFTASGVDAGALDNFNIGTRVFDAQQHIVGYSGGLAQLVTAEQQQGRSITFVDNMRSSLSTSDLVDGVHPTDSAYQTMGGIWFAALQAVTSGQLTNVAPTGPTGLVATAVSGTQINLTWTTNSLTESGFKVDVATSYDFSQGLTTWTASAGSDKLSVTGLTLGTTYYFRVRATNSFGDSPNSLLASATILPSGWVATDIGGPGLAGSTSFDGATWTVRGGGTNIWDPADQFQYAYTTVSGDANIVARVTSMQNTSSTAKAGLMFRDGTSATAAFVDVMQRPDNTVVMQWRDTAGGTSDWNGAGLGSTSSVKWLKLTRTGNVFAASYAATAGTPSSSDWVLVGTRTVAMAAPITGLAVTASNNSALCAATFTNVTLGHLAPTLTASVVSSSRVNLSWVANGSGQTGFKVERATDSGFSQNLILLTTTAANVTAYADTTVSSGMTYYYRVRATYSDGDSPNSNTASASVTPPAAPSGLTATTNGGQVNLNWVATGSGQTGFKVERATDNGFTQNLILLTTTAANVTSYADSTVSGGLTYYYRVRATNGIGDSPNSNTASATTLPSGWTAADIGGPGVAGSTAFDGTIWTVRGGGTNIWDPADQFQYAYTTVGGDATLVARVTSIQNTSALAKAGLMFRDGTGATAAFVDVMQRPDNTVAMQWRDTAGGTSDWNGAGLGGTASVKWLKLTRGGNVITAYYAATAGTPSSSDWVLVGTRTVAMTAPTTGLAVTAQNNSALCTATFTNVSFTGQWVQTTAADFGAGSNSGTQVTNTSGGEVQLASGSLNGTFTSVVFDATRVASWGPVSWTSNVPTGTTLTVQTRSGNSPAPDGTWSVWATAGNGQAGPSPAGRYVQYRVTLTSTSASLTPVLFDITFLWS
jgi:hypothetical protein